MLDYTAQNVGCIDFLLGQILGMVGQTLTSKLVISLFSALLITHLLITLNQYAFLFTNPLNIVIKMILRSNHKDQFSM